MITFSRIFTKYRRMSLNRLESDGDAELMERRTRWFILQRLFEAHTSLIQHCARVIAIGLIANQLSFVQYASGQTLDALPEERTIDWTNAGIAHIPERPVYSNVVDDYGALPNDGIDDRAAIQAALDECPPNSSVYIPEGIFDINGSLNIPSRITLTGAGSNLTTLRSIGAAQALINFGNKSPSYDPTGYSFDILSGSTRGSNTIAVATNSNQLNVSPGDLLVISEQNDTRFVSNRGSSGLATWVDGWNTGGMRSRGQIVEVTNAEGNELSFTPALYSDYSLTPWASRLEPGCVESGIEKLKIFATNSGTMRNVRMLKAKRCWVYDCEFDFTDGDHISIEWSFQCEVRRNFIHDAFIHTSGTYDSQVGLKFKSSACLIVDNIFYRMHSAVILQWGAAGNVVAYNYSSGHYDYTTTLSSSLMMDIVANHGAHPQYNLIEGNICQRLVADYFWGTSSHGLWFRNWSMASGEAHSPFNARGPIDQLAGVALTGAARAYEIWDSQTMYSAIGNLAGTTFIGSLPGAIVRTVKPDSRSYHTYNMYSYGYRTSGDSGGTTPDIDPTSTLIESNNWDFVNEDISTPAKIDDSAIPSSFYLQEKPDWFGSLAWPPIDTSRPDIANAAIDWIPAGYRFVHGNSDYLVQSPIAPSDLIIDEVD